MGQLIRRIISSLFEHESTTIFAPLQTGIGKGSFAHSSQNAIPIIRKDAT